MRVRSITTLCLFGVASVVALKYPLAGLGICICCLISYLKPDPPVAGKPIYLRNKAVRYLSGLGASKTDFLIYNQKTVQQGHPPDWTNREGGGSDLVVLGGGPAGLVAAITAATGGHRVAMTELAAGVQGSTALRRPLSAGALTRTYPPLPNITWILVDSSQLIRCELRSSVLCGVYRETVL